MPSLESGLNIYPLTNYQFKKKDAITNKDPSLPANLYRLKKEFDVFGPRRSVEAILLTHQNKMIHVLLLRWAPAIFILPGGELMPNEDEKNGLQRYLLNFFGIDLDTQMNIIDVVANWWRPNFESHQYPYIPAHISQPKELTKIFLLSMPEKANFSVPNNYDVVATPLFEIYENTNTYGKIISSLPQVLSRFNFNFV